MVGPLRRAGETPMITLERSHLILSAALAAALMLSGCTPSQGVSATHELIVSSQINDPGPPGGIDPILFSAGGRLQASGDGAVRAELSSELPVVATEIRADGSTDVLVMPTPVSQTIVAVPDGSRKNGWIVSMMTQGRIPVSVKRAEDGSQQVVWGAPLDSTVSMPIAVGETKTVAIQGTNGDTITVCLHAPAQPGGVDPLVKEPTSNPAARWISPFVRKAQEDKVFAGLML